jgi:hypothetical protein
MKRTKQAVKPGPVDPVANKGEYLAAIKSIQTLREHMPFLSPMGVTERGQLKRIGPTTLRVVQQRLAAAQEHSESLPATFGLEQFELDVGAAAALDQCVRAIDQLRSDVHDTYLTVGNRALRTSNEAYAHLRAAAVEKEQLQPMVAAITSRKARSRRQPVAGALGQPPTLAQAPPAAPPAPAGPAALPAPVGPDSNPEPKAA